MVCRSASILGTLTVLLCRFCVRTESYGVQERFYFGDTVLPLFESGIPLLRQVLRQLDDSENITVAYPDEGAWKRFHYQFDDYPEVGNGRCKMY